MTMPEIFWRRCTLSFDLRHGERVVEDCDAPVLDPVPTPILPTIAVLVVKVAEFGFVGYLNCLPISVLPISKLISGTAPCFSSA